MTTRCLGCVSKWGVCIALFASAAATLKAEPHWAYLGEVVESAPVACMVESFDGTILCVAGGQQWSSVDGGLNWTRAKPDEAARHGHRLQENVRDSFTNWMFLVGELPSSVVLSVSQDDGMRWERVCEVEDKGTAEWSVPTLFFTEKSILVFYAESRDAKRDEGKRWRYKVAVMDRGELTVGGTCPRTLGYPSGSRWRHWDGVDNVRDLGGLNASSGRTLKVGMIYRSQALNDNAICSFISEACLRTPSWFKTEYGEKNSSELAARIDPNDVTGSCRRIVAKLHADKEWWRKGELRGTAKSRLKVLHETGLKTELDLRSAAECWGMTGSPLGDSVRWCRRSCHGASMDWFVTKSGKDYFASIFSLFVSEEKYPIDIHCIAGADRTGCVVALLLALLEVPDEEILADYRMTSYSTSGHRSKSRFRERMAALGRYPGGSLAGQARAYARDCGISEYDIRHFQKIMLTERSSIGNEKGERK